MTKNRFETRVNLSNKLNKKSQLNHQKLQKYLMPLSLEFKGSPLSLLFVGKEKHLCLEFLNVMAKRGYPASVNLILEAKKSRRLLNSREYKVGSWTIKKGQRLVNRVTWEKLWVGRGYPIGIITNGINHSPSCQVYLCSDKKLRCTRTEPIFLEGNTLASGVGNLPNEEKLELFSFKTGRYVRSSYDSVLMFERVDLEELLNKIVDDNLVQSY